MENFPFISGTIKWNPERFIDFQEKTPPVGHWILGLGHSGEGKRFFHYMEWKGVQPDMPLQSWYPCPQPPPQFQQKRQISSKNTKH